MKVNILSTICLVLQLQLSISLFSFNSSPKSLSKIIEKDLRPLISQSKLGLNNANNNEIIQSIENVKSLVKSKKVKPLSINGKWRLLWTTEKVIKVYKHHTL